MKFIKVLLIAMTALGASACGNGADTPETYEETKEIKGERVSFGTFEGASKHVTTGSVELIRTEDGSYAIILGDDFEFDGAPAPVWGFGNGAYDAATKFAGLKGNKGRQVYELPASFDPTTYSHVVLYCEQFSVPLGLAALQ